MTYHDDITGFVNYCNLKATEPDVGSSLYEDAYYSTCMTAARIAADERLTTCEAWVVEESQRHTVPRDWDDSMRVWARRDALSALLVWFDQWRKRKALV